MAITLRFWDMDHTLIDNDCDVSWKTFMISQGFAPAGAMEKADFFFQQYLDGCLDVGAFIEFQLAEFKGRTEEEVRKMACDHFQQVVQEKLVPSMEALVQEQLAAGDKVFLLTATNRIIAEPVAAHLGMHRVYAAEPELADGRFTGRIAGDYTVGAGKVQVIEHVTEEFGMTPADAWYYGDSRTDIPVLEAVGHPVAVQPATALRSAAQENGWPILEW